MSDSTTRERILCEAEKRFVSEGIANTQMKDIAKTLNINRRTLYRYYPTKDELAFEIELVVMAKMQNSLDALINEDDFSTGFEKVQAYFENVDIESIKEMMRYTAEFDRYFQNDYPDREMEKRFLEVLNPENDALYRYIAEGVADGSIRNDLSAGELFHFISHSFIALFQRLILRRNHLNEEYCNDIDFKHVYKKVVLCGIKK